MAESRRVEPYEARKAPALPEDRRVWSAIGDVCIAVNGFYYPGERSDALIEAVAWLRTRPDLCADLGLGSEGEDA